MYVYIYHFKVTYSVFTSCSLGRGRKESICGIFLCKMGNAPLERRLLPPVGWVWVLRAVPCLHAPSPCPAAAAELEVAKIMPKNPWCCPLSEHQDTEYWAGKTDSLCELCCDLPWWSCEQHLQTLWLFRAISGSGRRFHRESKALVCVSFPITSVIITFFFFLPRTCLLCTSRTFCRKFLDCWWQPHGMSQLCAAFSLMNERILEA